jgi:hypothetical protein
MSGGAKGFSMRLVRLVSVFIVLFLALDGELSRAAALDRWVGSAIPDQTGLPPLDFIVLVNPGVSATWQWRLQGTVIASGPLGATVSGSRVNGTLYTTGGLAVQSGTCCRPCNFRGTMIGNQVNGTFDPASCSDDGTAGAFVLIKQ